MRKLIKEELNRHKVQKAVAVFEKYGVTDVEEMTVDQLQDVRNKLVKKHHPDRGGDVDAMQEINNAYDILKVALKTMKGDDGEKIHGVAIWAWAGYSGGSPPSDQIFGDSDINYFKKKAWEISGKPAASHNHEYTFWNFDGRYLRGCFTVFATEDKLYEVSLMMQKWDHFNKSVAVVVTHRGWQGQAKLVNVYGNKIKPLAFDHDSFNSNPSNDPKFCEKLARLLTNMRTKKPG